MKTYAKNVIQAMPLVENKVNLISGAHDVENLIHCVEDGAVTITWATNTTASIDMLAGQDFAFTGTVSVASGKFHLN